MVSPLHALIAATALAVLPAAAQADRGGAPVDAFGYALLDQTDAACAYAFVDVSLSGAPVAFSDDDDGGAVIALAGPFELYGAAVTDLVMSTNGYLAVASSLTDDDGGDFSNDAVLPAVPGDAPRANARLLVYHDDLDGAGGNARHEYFASCPRAADSGLDEPCTVVQWSDWGFAASADVFAFQAVLYHVSYEIVYQVGTGDSTAGASATLGIQNERCDVGLQHRGTVPAGTALCFFEPRFPASGPAADLEITIDDGRSTAVTGSPITYTIAVVHFEGPSPVTGAAVTADFPAALTGCAWTCAADPGSACTSAGNGVLADTVDLAGDGFVTYTVTCTVDPGAGGPLTATAAVSVPAAVSDPVPANDTASDVDQVVDAGIFADGFESGDVTAWSKVIGLSSP